MSGIGTLLKGRLSYLGERNSTNGEANVIYTILANGLGSEEDIRDHVNFLLKLEPPPPPICVSLAHLHSFSRIFSGSTTGLLFG